MFPLYKNNKNNAYLCDRCQETLALLFHAAETEPYAVYAEYREHFCKEYGGSDYATALTAEAEEHPWGGYPYSVYFNLPPFSCLVYQGRPQPEKKEDK